MRTGGIIALTVGGLALFGIVITTLTRRIALDGSLAVLAAAVALGGVILVVGSIILGNIEEDRVDHQAAQVDARDVAAIKAQVGEILAFVAHADLEEKQAVHALLASVDLSAPREQPAKQRQPQRQQSRPRRGGRNQRRRGGQAGDSADKEPDGAVWQPTDGRWMADVAEAARLGREMGGPASA